MLETLWGNRSTAFRLWIVFSACIVTYMSGVYDGAMNHQEFIEYSVVTWVGGTLVIMASYGVLIYGLHILMGWEWSA